MKSKKKNCSFVTVGIADNGKRIRKRIYYNTQSEYNDELQRLMRTYSGIKAPELLTLGVYVDIFKKAYISPLEVTTQYFYNFNIAKFSSLYHLRLISITRAQLQTVINDNAQSPCQCKHMKKAISRLFNCAVNDGYATQNPARGLTLPKYKQKERRALTAQELQTILSIDYEPAEYTAVMLLYVYGLRPEELRALETSDFDFDAKTLTINKAVVFDGNAPILKGTKTDETRVLPIPDGLIAPLRRYIADLKGVLLFPDKKGGYMSKGVFTHFYRKIFKRINCAMGQADYMQANSLSLYNWRHTVGSRLYYSPHVSNKYSAMFLGHKEEIFVKIYSHLDVTNENINAVFAEMGI